MRASIALCVCAFTASNFGYAQLGRKSQAPRDDLSLSGVIPDAPSQRPEPIGGSSPVVSMAELRHTIPGKARREMEKAQKACRKNELAACARYLQKAIEIDPEYLEARRELGRVYVGLDAPQKVIDAFQSVLTMDPRSADAYSFIGAAQASLEQYSDAELAARQALRIEPNHARGRFVLGMSLAGQRKNDSEALACLAAVSDVFPGAHMIEAHVLARRGETAEARSHLETYREVAPAAQRAEVEDWLARLQKAPRAVSASH